MKILVVDDDPQTLDALAVGFQLHWQDATVITAPDGEAGLQAFFEHDPDVVLLDVAMPGKNGFQVLHQIRQLSDVPVLMLTGRGQESDQVRGLELGADDYVVKPFSHLVLIARVKAVLRRADIPPPLQTAPDFVSGDLAVGFESRRVTLRGDLVRLTPIEYRLLYHLVRNAGRVMSHEALLHRVWGEAYGATNDHLKVFISRLRAKIERPGSPRLIQTERGLGYSFAAPRRQRREAPPPSGDPATP